MINSGNFINEINIIFRILIMALFCLITAAVVAWMQTRWLLLNVVLYMMVIIVLNGSAGALIVFLHDENYYLALNELTVLLLISAVLAVILRGGRQNLPVVQDAENIPAESNKLRF